MPFRVLVEGSDDFHLIKNVAREHGIDIQTKLHDCKGIDPLLNEILPVSLKAAYSAIAVVLDADDDLAARWNSIERQLTSAGYEVPPHPPKDGLITTNRRPAVGVWLMPDNSLPGALEDFATHLIPDNDPLWPRAVSAVDNIPAAERRFTATRKAEVHTWLAWQEEPGTPLGQAVTKKYFQTDSDLCKRFVRWLKQLKDLP